MIRIACLRLAVATTAVFLFNGIVQAAPGFTLECKVKSKGPDGGFGDRLYIAFENNWTNPAALNWAIQEIHKAPIPVRLLSNEGRRARVRWDIKGLKYRNGGSIGRTIYRASVDKTTLNLRLTSDIPGSDGRYFAEGQCKKIQ